MLKDYIFKRKSIREYKDEKLAPEILKKIENEIGKCEPLISGIDYKVTIADETAKSLFGVKAPHYLFFYSEEKQGSLENIGFIGQKLNLYLCSIGLGACWVGMAKPQDNSEKLPFVIAMAFGEANESLLRDESGFKRREISKISNADNEIMAAVRVAPSAVNFQDWYFLQEPGIVHCYSKNMGILINKVLGHMGGVDLGIAIRHLTLMCSEYKTEVVSAYPEVKDGTYFISIKSHDFK